LFGQDRVQLLSAGTIAGHAHVEDFLNLKFLDLRKRLREILAVMDDGRYDQAAGILVGAKTALLFPAEH
jgi:hypothetical protein